MAAPHLGAVIARTLGPLNPAVPAFIDIGQRFDVGEGEELKAFHTGGFLGSEYGPFVIANPEQAVQSVRPPAGMSPRGVFDETVANWCGPDRAGDVRHSVLDPGLAARELGWTPSVSLAEGIARTWQWFVERASRDRCAV